MPNDPTFKYGDASFAPLDDYVPVTPGASDLPDGPCRAILATVAGTVNLTTPGRRASDGSVLPPIDRDGVPVNVGTNPLCASKIRAGGTATGLFAGY